MKRLSFTSLRVKLIFLVLLSVIPALGLTLYSGLEQRRHARLDALDNALELAKEASDDQERLIDGTHQLLIALAQMDQVLQCQSSGYSPFLASLLKEYSFYTNLGTTGTDGQVICSALPMKQPTNFADREWFPRILHTRKFTVSEYLIGRITGKPSIVLSYPILAGTEHLKALVFVSIDLAWLNQIVAKAKLPSGSVFTVFDRKGTILARYPDPEKWVGRSMSDTPLVKTILTRQEEGTDEITGIDGVLRLYAFTLLSKRKEVGAYVSVGIPSTVAFAEANRILIRNIVFLGLASIMVLIAAWWFGGLFVMHPMNRLLNTTKRLADGDLTVRTGSSYPRGEIGQLARSFDQMAESLERREAERKRAEDMLGASEERYKTLFEGAAEGILVADIESKQFKYVNPATCRILGYTAEELTRLSLADIHPKEALDYVVAEFEAQARGEKTLSPEIPCLRKDGSVIYTSVITAPAVIDGRKCNIGFFTDITERKRAEEEREALQDQLRQSQKMEAIGRLAGGIAHDFNNLLTVIKGYSQLSLMELKEGDPLRPNIEEIQKAAERAAGLTRQLLAFSRRQILEMTVLNLNTILRDLDKMLHRIIGEDIELVTLLADDLGTVKADAGQIEQVVMNLAVNARDAMQKGGKLTIETGNVELDSAYAGKHVAVKPGPYVMLSVSDTGVGMTPEVRNRVFEPFFTTKEKGKGTGLGLSTVYGIVKQSGGNIWVYSEFGKGTAFKIYLPRVDEPPEEAGEKVVQKEIAGRGETILVVEDEEKVRQLTVQILTKNGYTVLEASHGDEASHICEQHKGPIHLMVMDVVMPGMTGRELAKSLEPHHPEMKVLYMSGYTDNAIVHHGILEKGLSFLQKPFTLEGLLRKMREVLDK